MHFYSVGISFGSDLYESLRTTVPTANRRWHE